MDKSSWPANEKGVLMKKKIKEVVDKIEELKPMSQICMKAIHILQDSDSTISDIVDIIQYDPGLTANLLRICNSTYFSPVRPIESLRQAVAYLGMEKVANMLVMAGSSENFRNSHEGYDLPEGELWRYSVSSALISQDIAEKLKFKNIPLIFTSALLKDIGKVILSSYVQEAFSEIWNMVKKLNFSFNEAEKEVIGIDHAELGAMIVERWNFSPEMVKIIRNHHDPDKADGDMGVSIVYLADSVCMMIGVGVGSDGLSYRYHNEVMEKLGISPTGLQLFIMNYWENMRNVEELINITKGVN